MRRHRNDPIRTKNIEYVNYKILFISGTILFPYKILHWRKWVEGVGVDKRIYVTNFQMKGGRGGGISSLNECKNDFMTN